MSCVKQVGEAAVAEQRAVLVGQVVRGHRHLAGEAGGFERPCQAGAAGADVVEPGDARRVDVLLQEARERASRVRCRRPAGRAGAASAGGESAPPAPGRSRCGARSRPRVGSPATRAAACRAASRRPCAPSSSPAVRPAARLSAPTWVSRIEPATSEKSVTTWTPERTSSLIASLTGGTSGAISATPFAVGHLRQAGGELARRRRRRAGR